MNVDQIVVSYHRPDAEFIVEFVECCGSNRWRERVAVFTDAHSANSYAESEGRRLRVPVFTY